MGNAGGSGVETVKKLKVQVVEMQLQNILMSEEKDLKSKKNDMLPLLLIYEWFLNKKNYFYCIYNLFKIHDCSNCSLTECFQYYIVKRLII